MMSKNLCATFFSLAFISYDKVSANPASSVPKCTQNRTDHRMHVEGPQICQIKRWNNSFQNMHGLHGMLSICNN